jgi:hypothetical protein
MAHVVGLTPAFAGSKLTVAVIVEVACACIDEGLEEREISMAAKVIPTLPDLVESVTELAVMVTCTSLVGGVAGAV